LKPAVQRCISKLCIIISKGEKRKHGDLIGKILRIAAITLKNEEKWKKATSLTCIYILTDINAAGGLTDSTPCYMKYSIKYIWVSIMHSHSAKKKVFMGQLQKF
jgi:hypothetical protein